MELVVIEARGEHATFAPEMGCQCFGYQVGALDLIAAPESAESLRAHPFRSGMPIQFPWPGRIRNGVFTFAGREIHLPINEPARGHAIHGLVWNCAFEVMSRGIDRVRMRLDSSTDAAVTRIWPFPFVLEIDLEVGGGLRVRFSVRNSGASAMPFGIGAHPYFHAPLETHGARDAIEVEAQPAKSRWPLDAKLIPSGAPIAAAGDFDFSAPRPLDAHTYDDVFQLDSARDPSRPCARLIDRAARCAIEIRADPQFRDLVVYAPPDKPVVALEPYTCAPDAFNLNSRGIDAGMLTLAPGAVFEAGFEIRAAELANSGRS